MSVTVLMVGMPSFGDLAGSTGDVWHVGMVLFKQYNIPSGRNLILVAHWW
jgi:hypothetical protein